MYASLPISGGLIRPNMEEFLYQLRLRWINQGIKTRKGIENHEQVTPTGAAIVSTLGTQEDFPNMTITNIGYGAGTRNPSEYANISRVSIGELQISIHLTLHLLIFSKFKQI